jgi:hypothetical protein
MTVASARAIFAIRSRTLRIGALEGDIIYGSRWFFEGSCLARRPSDLICLRISRPLLEVIIWQHLLSLANVRALEDCAVESLLENSGSVTGIRLGNGSVIEADLVVDASGRGSQSPQWLEAIGHPRIVMRVIKGNLLSAKAAQNSPTASS